MDLIAALHTAFSLNGLSLLGAGCVVALVLGMLPGLSSTEAMIILLPFTYSLNIDQSMLLLSSAYASAFVGGALTSIVFGIPGSSTGLATVLDGHPLHQQGRTIFAVTVAAVSSAVAGLLALFIVIGLMPVMEPLSLMFGPPEWFAFVVFGLVVLAFSDEHNFVRGLIAASLGMLCGAAGISVVTAEPRFTFGLAELWGGVPIVAAFVGLYPLGEAMSMMMGEHTQHWSYAAERRPWKEQRKEIAEGAWACFRHFDKLGIAGIVGWVIGVIPGVGATLANIIGYLVVKETARKKDGFGKGEVRGLIASESANNASVGGALVPALALGIPGSLNTAILLGVFMINGIQPGTNVFAENLDVTWAILIAVAVGTVLASALVIFGGWRLVSLVTRIHPRVVAPVIIIIGFCAVLFARGNPLDLIIAGGLGILGVFMKRYSFSRISFVIALMLGPLFESSYFQSLSIGRGHYSIFVHSYISAVLWICIAACLLLHIKRSYGRARQATTVGTWA